MLLTVTTTYHPARDLGFLLHKHPDRHQTFDLSFGKAHVFFPEAEEERCTAALLLDVDPVGLVHKRRGEAGDPGLLGQYVNDRPYAASSFLSVALRRVFASALAGRSEHRPTLAAGAIPLTARVTPLRSNGGETLLHELFEPLGYELQAVSIGAGTYWDVTLGATTRLADLLNHLYVLVPVLDDQKHYWVGEDEIEKLMRAGEGWLPQHPQRDLIIRRYMKHERWLTRAALERLEALDDAPETEAAPRPPRLNDERLAQVVAELAACNARSVADLGCGSGRLLSLLLKVRQFERILGMDVSARQLDFAAGRLKLDRMPESERARISLLQGSLTYRDKRLAGFDAAAGVEVIEHIDPPRLGAFADALFATARPRTIVLTTPNAEYNARYEAVGSAGLRHADHRFEWSRAQFEGWARAIGERYGYGVRFGGIGQADPALGAPTQLGVFTCS